MENRGFSVARQRPLGALQVDPRGPYRSKGWLAKQKSAFEHAVMVMKHLFGCNVFCMVLTMYGKAKTAESQSKFGELSLRNHG